MTTWKSSIGFAAVILSISSILPAGAQTRYNSQLHGTSVKINGTSTYHEWEMEGTMVGGFAEFGADVKLDANETEMPGAVKVHALIPVSTVHSKAEHAPDVMDHLMQEHLKADKFSTIDYTLGEMIFKGPHAAGQPFNFDTTGSLAIAGVTNKVSFPVTLEVLDANKIKIHAVVPLKMTAYGVDPPAPNIGLGLMRCGDDIKIIIDWTLMKKK